MLLRDAAQRRTQRMSGNVLHPAVLYEARQVPVAVGIPDPAVAVAGPLEPERPRRFERRAGAPLHFGPEGVEPVALRSEEHTSELQSLMRISYAVFCLTTNNSL